MDANMYPEQELLAALIMSAGGQLAIPRRVLDQLPRNFSLQVSEDMQAGTIVFDVFPE